MKFSVSILFLLFFTSLQGQGLIFNDAVYNSSPKSNYEGDGSKGEEALLNTTFKVDLKPYCPTVREQGKISSCVGWSVGYAAMTIENALANNWANDQKTIDNNAYSAMFVYNQIKLGDCSFGAELNQAFAFLKENGNVFYRDFAVINDCDSVPMATLAEKARLNQVKDFTTLFSPDAKDDVKIQRVKLALAHRKPVVIGMVVLENFLTLKSNDHMWYPSIGKTDLFGGHAMVVIGYDDGKKAFEIMNSWGRGWANQGFVWVRYEDFSRYCKYAYQLSMDKRETNTLEGNIQLLRPVMKSASNGVGNVMFSALPLVYNNNRYQLADEEMTLPLQFQLVAEGLRKHSYLYVISFDKNLKPTVHWPRHELLNKQFVAERQSAIIASDDDKVTVPGRYNVFSISEPGTEYLCILNSTREIKNLSKRIDQIRNSKGDIYERIKKALNDVKNSHGSYYQNDRISFYGDSNSELISVLLEFALKR